MLGRARLAVRSAVWQAALSDLEATTAPGWYRRPGQRPGSRSRGTPTSSGSPCRKIARPPSSLGDLLCYDGIGHGAIYVGGGYIIHAPRTGMDLQKIPMNASWYE